MSSAFKSVLKALRSGSKGSPSPGRVAGAAEDEQENSSPLVPRRLLSLTPASAKPDARGLRPAKSGGLDAAPRTLLYDDASGKGTPRRQASARPSSQKIPAGRAASTPLATPRMSRFSHQQQDAGVGVGGAAADAGSLPDPSSDNIKVIVRVRPKNEREAALGGAVCVQPLSGRSLRVASHPEPHQFSFDHVADERASQESMFRAAGRPIVENCLAGYNGCIFAYGQTGSGKTHTMLGADAMACDPQDENRGLIQRVFEHLFARIQERQAEGGDAKYNLRCCFLEIYNENITDLLNPAATNLAVREDLRRGVYVEGLHEAEVTSVEDVVALLQQGAANRRVAETEMNEKSSRSHSVFTCTLESKTTDEYGAPHLRFSRLHLVDLAGSERQKSSGAQGERLKEASSINKSLSTLGLVIMSLVDRQHGKARHIPYRDSRLTFLLQDSLGGNAKTCLVATISPAAINMAETLSTLRFADNAKRIKNKAVVNEDLGDAAALRREVKRLREELAAARRAAAAGQAAGGAPADATGTPARIASAAADALASAAATPSGASMTAAGGGAARKALVGALRREDAAVKQVRRLEAQVDGMKELVASLQQDAQRSQMMMKLKESRLARLQGGAAAAAEGESELVQELALLRAKVEAHPEVKRFAVENLHLSREMERLATLVDRNELAALSSDLDVLRGEMLALADSSERAQEEAAAQRAAAESIKLEADLAAEALRAKAVAEVQARAAAEAAQLRAQVFEVQRSAREAEAVAGAAARENEELQARVAMLTEEVAALEAARAALKAEMSPVKRTAHEKEQEAVLLRQQSQAADLRASTEQTLRSQAELTVGQLQAHLAALESECERLRSINQELCQAKEDAEQQRDTAAGVEALCATLKQQLESERSAAVEREADRVEAQHSLEAARRQVGSLQGEVERLEKEVLEAQAALGQQKDEHEAAQSAAAMRITAALKAAGELQVELDARTARVTELQAAREELQTQVDELTQRCTELHDEQVRLTSKLAQRDNELLEIEQTVDDLEGKLDEAQRGSAAAAEERKRLEEQLAAREAEVESVRSELAAMQGRLAEATTALAEAGDQMAQLEDRLSAAEEQQAEMEYTLSDKSASLQEAGEALARAKADLAAAQAVVQEREGALAAAEVRVADAVAASEAAATRAAAELSAAVAAAEAAAAAQRDAAAAQLADAEEALAAARARCTELEGSSTQHAEALADVQRQLADTEGALDAAQGRCHELAAQLGAAENTAAEREEAAAATSTRLQEARERLAELGMQHEAAVARGAELAAQLDRLQREVVLEKEKGLLLAAAELKETKAALAAERDAAVALQEALAAKDREIAQVRADMAAEVSEAAQQVQALLAAQAQVESLQSELAGLRQRLEGTQAEAAAAAAEGQQATLTAAQAKAQIEELVREREVWIEELRRERTAASAAMDGLRALERRVEEGEAERATLAADLEETRARATQLEEEVTALTGQQNINQRIQYHKKVKDENNALREELGRLRIEAHRAQVRLERATDELGRMRQAAGQGGLPDFDAEERLQQELAHVTAENGRLQRQYASLAAAVAALAHGGSSGQGSSAAAVDADADGDIVLEFESPERSRGAGAGGGALGAPSQALEVATRQALEDIRHAQARAARGIADREQQIRLLQESQKLSKLRRTSVVETAAQR